MLRELNCRYPVFSQQQHVSGKNWASNSTQFKRFEWEYIWCVYFLDCGLVCLITIMNVYLSVFLCKCVCVFWYRWTVQICIKQIWFSVTCYCACRPPFCLFLFISICLNFSPSNIVSKSFNLGWATAHTSLPAPSNTCFVLVCLKTPTVSKNTILYIKDEAFAVLGLL